MLIVAFLQQLDSYGVSAFNRLLGKYQQLKEQLATKEVELRVATSIFLVLFFSGGTLAHPLGVAPEIRADC